MRTMYSEPLQPTVGSIRTGSEIDPRQVANDQMRTMYSEPLQSTVGMLPTGSEIVPRQMATMHSEPVVVFPNQEPIGIDFNSFFHESDFSNLSAYNTE